MSTLSGNRVIPRSITNTGTGNKTIGLNLFININCPVNNNGYLTLSGILSGGRALTFFGNGTTELTNSNNTYDGKIQLRSGTLKISGNSKILTRGAGSNNSHMINGILEHSSSEDLIFNNPIDGPQFLFNITANPNAKIISNGPGKIHFRNPYADNSFNGTIEINSGGYVKVGNNDTIANAGKGNGTGSIAWTQAITISSGGTLEFDRNPSSSSIDVFAVISGSGPVIVTRSSTINFWGINSSHNGSFTIQSGKVNMNRQSSHQFVNNGTLTLTMSDPSYWQNTGLFVFSRTANGVSTTYTYLTDYTIGTSSNGFVNNVQIQAAGLGNDMTEFSGFVAGRIALVQRGVQPFQTKVNNAIAAGAVGVIMYNNTTGLTTPTLTANIPVVMVTQALGQQLISEMNAGTVTASINTGLPFGVSSTPLFNNSVSGTGVLSKAGSGTIVIGPNVNHSGSTNITAGALRIDGSDRLPNSSVSVSSGAAFEILGGSTFSRNISINGTGISSGGAIRNISGNNTLNGNYTLTAASRINSDADELVLNGTVGTGATGLTVGGSGNITLNGFLVTITGLTKDGAGRLVINGNNTFNGTTTLSAGVLRVGHASALGVATSTVSIPASTAIEVINGISFARNLSSAGTGVSSAGSLRSISGNNTFSGNYTLTAASRINSDADTLTLSSAGTLTGTFGLTFGGAGNININRAIATSTGAVTKDGTGTATFLATNTYSGTTTISAGTLQIGSNGTAGTLGTGNVVNNATLIFNRSNNNTISNVISGTGSFVHNGSGTTTLSGNNTYSGGTTINGGTLVAGSNTCFGTGPITVNAGATLDTAGRTLSNTIVNNGGTVISVVPWTPSQLGSNLAVWLDADDSSTITLNGSTVSQWRDKSVNARHLSQANAANQPTRTLNALNGGTALTFSGNQWLFNLAVSGLLRNVAGGSLTVVTNYTNAIQQRFAASVLNSLSTSRAAVFLQPTSLLAGGGRRVDSDAFTAALSATAYTNGTSVIQSMSLNFAANINSQFVNGSAAGTSTFSGGGNSSDTAALSLAVGCSTADGISAGNLMAGLVSEVVLTHGDPTTLDRQRIEGYLAHKWGLTTNLPTDHPFKNSKPTI